MLYNIVANLTSSYKKDLIDSSTENEVIKGAVEDNNLDIHLENHKANVEYGRKLMKGNREHEMPKIIIILPICVVIVLIIRGTCLMVYFKDKLPKLGNGGNVCKNQKL